MAGTEDYLDSLLNTVTQKLNKVEEDYSQRKEETSEYAERGLAPKTVRALEEVKDNQFLADFEGEMSTDDVDDFLADFEAELNGDIAKFEKINPKKKSRDDYMNQVDMILAEDEDDFFGSVDTDFDDSFFDEGPVASPNENSAETPDESDSLMEVATDATNTSDLPVDSELGALFEGDDAPSNTAQEVDAEQEELAALAKSLSDDGTIFSPIIGDSSDGTTNSDSPISGMDELAGLFDDESSEKSDATVEPRIAEEDVVDGGLDDLGDDFGAQLDDIDSLSDDGILDLLGEVSGDGDSLGGEGGIGIDDISDDPANLDRTKSVIGGGSDDEPKAPEKKNFFKKLLDFFFGEDEEESEDIVPGEGASGEGDELDNLFGDATPKKAEKKEKPKKEKPKKEPPKKKSPKPKKAPKPKAEPGPKGKPLPKVPVILIVVLGITVFVLINTGTSLIGYSGQIFQSQEKYDKGDYLLSYAKVAGTDIAEADIDLYHKAKVLAGVQEEIRAYYSMMEVKKYDLALDCLIRGLGRYELHNGKAEEWGVSTPMAKMREELVTQLQDQFSVSADRALEIYSIESRLEYSRAINEILRGLDLMQ